MKYFRMVLKNSRLFFLLLLVIAIAALCFTQNFYLPVSASHPGWLNIFFINYTFMGDGVFIIGLVLFFYFLVKDKKTATLLFFTFLFSELMVQLIKNNFVFQGFKLFVEEGQYLFVSAGTLSYPDSGIISGHTALAFMIATVFLVRIKDKSWQALLFLAAALLAFSRIYLAQNSMTEVVIGALTGTFSALFFICCLENLRTIKWFLRLNNLKEQPGSSAHVPSLSNQL